MGRPKGQILRLDVEQITKWAKTGATQEEIAKKLGCSLTTFERRLADKKDPRYRQAMLIGRGELCLDLRSKQVEIALNGNVQMLKWLGEQYLQQAHAHRIVDRKGEDVPIGNDIETVRRWMREAPPEGEAKTAR